MDIVGGRSGDGKPAEAGARTDASAATVTVSLMFFFFLISMEMMCRVKKQSSLL